MASTPPAQQHGDSAGMVNKKRCKNREVWHKVTGKRKEGMKRQQWIRKSSDIIRPYVPQINVLGSWWRQTVNHWAECKINRLLTEQKQWNEQWKGATRSPRCYFTPFQVYLCSRFIFLLMKSDSLFCALPVTSLPDSLARLEHLFKEVQ